VRVAVAGLGRGARRSSGPGGRGDRGPRRTGGDRQPVAEFPGDAGPRLVDVERRAVAQVNVVRAVTVGRWCMVELLLGQKGTTAKPRVRLRNFPRTYWRAPVSCFVVIGCVEIASKPR